VLVDERMYCEELDRTSSILGNVVGLIDNGGMLADNTGSNCFTTVAASIENWRTNELVGVQIHDLSPILRWSKHQFFFVSEQTDTVID
jgi:hypothetical protein